jgi:hypothetical protein
VPCWSACTGRAYPNVIVGIHVIVTDIIDPKPDKPLENKKWALAGPAPRQGAADLANAAHSPAAVIIVICHTVVECEGLMRLARLLAQTCYRSLAVAFPVGCGGCPPR